MTDDTCSSAPETPPAAPALAPVGPQPPARHAGRTAILIAGVVVALGLSLTFAPVRALAAQVLSIFRVQKIATVSITQDDLKQIGQSLERGDSHVSLKDLGDIWIDGKPSLGGEEPTPTTLSAAQAAVDFPIRVPSGVEGTQSVFLQAGSTVKLKLNVDKVNELLRYYGAEKLFSKSLDGKTFEIKVPPTVYLAYGKKPLAFTASAQGDMMSEEGTPTVEPDPMSQDVFIVQTRGPELVVPAGVNPLEIRDVLLNLPFLPQDVRNQLAGVSDWQHTLLLPSFAGSTRNITVAGNPGVVITPPADGVEGEQPTGPDQPAAVMWHQDDVLLAVATAKKAKSLSIAESLAK